MVTPPGQKYVFKNSAPSPPQPTQLQDYIILSVHRQLEEKVAWELAGHPSSWVRTKKNEISNTSYPWILIGLAKKTALLISVHQIRYA